MIDYAHEIGLKGIAITDHDVVANHVKALQHLAKRRKENPNDPSWQNFKLILGNEIYLVRNGLSKDNFVSGVDRFYHFILLAKDEVGHKQIRELSSRAWKQSFYRFMERVPTYYSDIKEVIGANPGHVMASTACLGGYLPSLIMEAKQTKDSLARLDIEQEMDEFIEWMIEVFGRENFFLEKQPSLNKEQWVVNEKMEQLAEKHNLKCIITTDAHYLRKEDRPIHKAYLNAKQGDREVDEFYASTYVMNAKEVAEYFTQAEEKFNKGMNQARAKEVENIVARDLNNTNVYVAAQVNEYSLAHSPIIPHTNLDWFMLTPAQPFTVNGKSYEFINKFATSPHEQDRYFISKVMQQLVKKFDPLYLENHLERYYERIDIECKELWNISEKLGQRLSSYLLLIAEITRIIWDEGDSLVGPGRGSSSGFLTNYLLDIVQVNPLEAEVELPHWRSKLIGLPLWRHNENNFVNARKSGVKLA